MVTLTTTNENTACGFQALYTGTTIASSTAMGTKALYYATGDSNTAHGYQAGLNVSTGANNTFLGYQSGISGSPGGNITTASNEVCIGDENVQAANIQVDWTIASDERDKTDFTDLDLGLNFVNGLKPFTYKWDKRIKYVDRKDPDVDLNKVVTDGTHKEDWLDIGFKAQDVEALEEASGYIMEDKTNLTTHLSQDGKQYGLTYSKFVPILTKAIQELSKENDELRKRLDALEE